MEKRSPELGNFVLAEMHKLNMSAREFAKYVGVSNTTINRMVDPEDESIPTLEFLLKLADATQTDITALLAKTFPETIGRFGLSADARIFGRRYEQAPPHIREAVNALLSIGEAPARRR